MNSPHSLQEVKDSMQRNWLCYEMRAVLYVETHFCLDTAGCHFEVLQQNKVS